MSSDFPKVGKRIAAAAGILFLLSGCTTLIDKPPDIPWHVCYQTISNPQALSFRDTGIAFLQTEYGSPETPVNRVMLRFSKKTETAKNYRIGQYFSRKEIVDAEKGVFCIYVGVPPSHERFYYLLGHEIGHLLHPRRVDDSEMERFCNEFSRRLCEKENKKFNPSWENRKWVLQPKETANE